MNVKSEGKHFNEQTCAKKNHLQQRDLNIELGFLLCLNFIHIFVNLKRKQAKKRKLPLLTTSAVVEACFLKNNEQIINKISYHKLKGLKI